MFAWIRALLAPSKEKTDEGIYYVGDGFGKGSAKRPRVISEPDQNGKLYRFYRLISEGEHKGQYTPVTVFGLGPSDQQTKMAEELDILKSGLELYALDRSEMRFKTFKLTPLPLSYSEWLKRDNAAIKAVKLLAEKANIIK